MKQWKRGLVAAAFCLALLTGGCSAGENSKAISLYNNAQKELMKLSSYKQESVSVNRPNDPELDPEVAANAVISRTDTILFNIVNGKKVSLTDISFSGENNGAASQYFIDHKNEAYYMKDTDGWTELDKKSLSSQSPSSSDSIYWVTVDNSTIEKAEVEETENGHKVTYTLKNTALEDYAKSNPLNLEETSSIYMVLTTDGEGRPLTLNSKYSFTRDIQGYKQYISVEDNLTFSDFNQVEKLEKENIVK